MNDTSKCILLILVLVMICALVKGATVEHYQNPATIDSPQFFPFLNPFKPKFYKKVQPVYRLYTDNTELHQPLLNNIMESYQLVDHPSEFTLQALNNRTLDFIIDTEHNIAPRYLGTAHPNIRFMCALYSPVLILLSSNNSNIIDMGDLKHWGPCKIKIAINSSSNSQAIMALLAQYDLEHAEVVKVTRSDLIRGYGKDYQIYADLAMSYDQTILELTNSVPSHLVSMRHINGGEYHITLSEQDFYKNYPYYEKDMIELKALQRYYPQLSKVHNRDLYYPTIKTKYVLLCHDRISGDDISVIMHKILVLMHQHWEPGYNITTIDQQESKHVNQLFKGTTVADISHISTSIPMHDAIKVIFRDLELHSIDGNSFYNGE